ncbi:MAG: M20/M25/M40 family metallo-hydrolase [Acidobacteria bacterium]|nr:M20/M25/M40 family metallo-hydrolase [Acidobacteriota bacterium]
MRIRLFRAVLCVVAAVAGQAAPVLAAPQPDGVDPRIVKLLEQVSEPRMLQTLTALQAFVTRNTLSSTDQPTRGIGAARQWILDEMTKASPRLHVSFDAYQIPAQGRITREVDIRNVMAVLPGRTARRLYVSAHYDSLALPRRNEPTGAGTSGARGAAPPAQAPRPETPPAGAAGAPPANLDGPAPGVNDDGSGTAAVMELARIFAQSGIEFDATLVFIALAGEEQGLIGAKLHAQKAAAEKTRIDAVLNNDMIGNAAGGSGVVDGERVRVFSEGPEDSPSRQVARYVARVGPRYVPSQRIVLVARHDRFGRGGDHTAFNQNGFAGVRITEANEHYGRQHTTDDTLDGVSSAYLMKNTRMNAAVLASLALAPAAPTTVDDRGRSHAGARTLRLRCESAVGRLFRGGRLPGLLARGVDAGLAARRERRRRDAVRHAGRVD